MNAVAFLKRKEGDSVRKHISKRYVSLVLTVAIAYAGYGFACSSNDVHKVKVKVDQAASILNTAAKSNRELYRSGVYGTVGASPAIATRQKVATGIHEANEYLSDAVEIAAQLQPGISGQVVVDLLTKAAQSLARTHI